MKKKWLVALVLVAIPGFYLWQAQSYTNQNITLTGVQSDNENPKQFKKIWPVHIHQPVAIPRVKTNLVGVKNQELTVSCSSCHTTREPNYQTKKGEDLDTFHQHLTIQHGDLTCLSCHNSDNYDTLRLADGRKVDYSDVMQLCAQCHGPQHRDYQRGSHGGMTGYWSLEHGPRSRNHCIDCHDPHAPAFVGMQPASPPNDRFLHSEPNSSH